MKKKLYCVSAVALILVLSVGVAMHFKSRASAADGVKEESPTVVAYDKSDTRFDKYVIDETLINDPNHNLMSNETTLDQYNIDDVEVIVYPLSDTHLNDVLGQKKLEDHVLTETKGNYIPTSFWNLDTYGPYQYSIVNMQHYVYTGFYFNVDYKNCIAMSMGTLNSGHQNVTFGLYETGTNTCVTSWTCDPQSIAGLGFTNLNAYKTYYIKFSISSGSLTGSGYVMHD